MNRLVLLLPLLLAVTPSARADEALDAGQALLDGIAPADSRLVGRTTWGLRLRGRAVGTLVLDVAPVTTGGFRVALVAEHTIEGVAARLEERGHLGPRLEPVDVTLVASEGDGPPEVTVVRRLRLAFPRPAAWTVTTAAGTTTLLAQRTGVLASTSARLLLARLALSAPGPDRAVLELATDEGRARRLELTASGRAEDGPRLRLVPRDPAGAPVDEAWVHVGGPDGVEAFFPAARPALVFARAADLEAARRDRPGQGEPPPGSARAVALEYLRALVRRDAARFARTIDWPALRASLGFEGPVEALKEELLRGVAEPAEPLELEADDVEELAPALEEAPAADGGAWVTIPGEPERLRLKKGPDGAWKITGLGE